MCELPGAAGVVVLAAARRDATRQRRVSVVRLSLDFEPSGTFEIVIGMPWLEEADGLVDRRERRKVSRGALDRVVGMRWPRKAWQSLAGARRHLVSGAGEREIELGIFLHLP